jgi:cob(I)alamin adenosyltransferase
MVNLTRIYTKTGDDGTTSLGDMSRTSKNDPRLEAYATVDEANSAIGVALCADSLPAELKPLLIRIQNDLFDVGADLCTPVVDEPKIEPLRVLESQITFLEEQIDAFNEQLEPLRSFVLPSGTLAAANLHIARAVARRAERCTWAAIHAFGGGVNPLAAKYLTRLSDLLFVLARISNKEQGDELWVPGANR